VPSPVHQDRNWSLNLSLPKFLSHMYAYAVVRIQCRELTTIKDHLLLKRFPFNLIWSAAQTFSSLALATTMQLARNPARRAMQKQPEDWGNFNVYNVVTREGHSLYMVFKFVYCFTKFLAFLILHFTLKALYLPLTVGSYNTTLK